jgi:hypothetical protein
MDLQLLKKITSGAWKVDYTWKGGSCGFNKHRYGQALPIPSTRTTCGCVPEVKHYKSREGADAEKRAIRRQIELPSTRSICNTPKEIHPHSSYIPSSISSIAIAISIVIEISLRIDDHCKNIVISI